MKVLVLAGSLRKESFNKKLARIAARAVREAGHDVDLADGREIDMPVYDFDVETAGFPESVLALVKRVRAADAVVISTPEYNYGAPGPVKNAIDWVSRFEKPNQAWRRRPILILAASPSMAGGVRGADAVRGALMACGALVHPDVYSLPKADEAFVKEDLVDPKRAERLAGMLRDWLVLASKVR